VTVSWFGPQNQTGFDLSDVTENRREDEDDTWHVLGSSGLLLEEVSRARVSQSSLKIGRGTTVCGARGTITEVM
jgi:hypothetical protein